MRDGQPDRAVATSKTFRQLARTAGAAPSSEGPYIRRRLSHADLTKLSDKLASMSAADRAQMPGVSRGRAGQLAAGAIVADAAMDLFDLERAVHLPVGAARGRDPAPAGRAHHRPAGTLSQARRTWHRERP